MATIDLLVPVVFSDGESDRHIGNIRISPSTHFKNFQLILCNKIGVAPHQISIYYVDQRKSLRVTVTHKFNFSTISRDMESSYFQAILRRSRKERRRGSYDIVADNRDNSFGLENMVLLRRGDIDSESNAWQQRYQREYDNRLMELQMQRNQFLMMSGAAAAATARDNRNTNQFSRNQNLYPGNWNDGEEVVEGAVCADCVRGEPGFHLCVRDPIVLKWFRTETGPIARPVRPA